MLGFKYGERIKIRQAGLFYLKKVLIMLRGEINYNISELNEVFRVLMERTEGDFKKFFENLHDRTDKIYENTISTYWKEEVDRCLLNDCFTKEDIMRIKELGENIGYLDREMQINSIDYILEYIDGEIDRLNLSVDKNVKMYKMLGILSGVFLAIILC